MKVYELMKELSEMPAGARVEIRTCIDTEEILTAERGDDGEYLIYFDIEDVDKANNKLVVLYN